jgi:hypothetical protein
MSQPTPATIPNSESKFYNPPHPTVQSYVQHFGGSKIFYYLSYPFLVKQWKNGGHCYGWTERSKQDSQVCRDWRGLVRGDVKLFMQMQKPGARVVPGMINTQQPLILKPTIYLGLPEAWSNLHNQ